MAGRLNYTAKGVTHRRNVEDICMNPAEAEDEKMKDSETGATPKRSGEGLERIRPNYSSQLSLIMLAVLRALRRGGEFSIGHDVKEAGLFGDLVFRRPATDGKNILYIFVSMVGREKTPQGPSELVTRSALSAENGPYSLLQYCNSFLKIGGTREKLVGVDNLTVVTVGEMGESECLEPSREEMDQFLGLKMRALKEIPAWREKMADKLGRDHEEAIGLFLRKLRFADYTLKGTEDHLRILQEIVKTERPKTYFLMFKEAIEEWFTSPEGKYLTSGELLKVLSENSQSLQE